MISNRARCLTALLACMVAVPVLIPASAQVQAQGQTTQRLFQETGKTVRGRFLEYWDTNGGLPQQGFPVSEEMQERSDTDGKTYTVQYFERAVLEYHPEEQPEFQVLLSLLGVFYFSQKYPGGAPNQQPNNEPGSVLVPETGKRLGGIFKRYWETHGGLAQQGYPVSDEFTEISDLNGKPYKVQYFQRAVFEYHPEEKPEYQVLLSQLGTFRHRQRYLQPPAVTATTMPPTSVPPTQAALPTATGAPAPAAIPQPPEFAQVRARFENMTPEQWKPAGYVVGYPCARGIGVRLLHDTLEAQASGQMPPDLQTPPVVYADRNRQRIIGLQWVAPRNQASPVLFGQQMWVFTPPSPGAPPVYGLFSFFKPDGHVLFAQSDPDDPCSR